MNHFTGDRNMSTRFVNDWANMSASRMMEDGEVMCWSDGSSVNECFTGSADMMAKLEHCHKAWRSGPTITAMCYVADPDDGLLHILGDAIAQEVCRCPAEAIRVVSYPLEDL
jgi:glutamine synthetase